MNERLTAAKKILVIRYRFIGDTILTVPFLRNLRRAYPDSQIDVLVGPQSGQVLSGCPYVDNLIEYDTTRFHKYDSGKGKAKSFWSYVLKLRKEGYELVFVLKRSWSSAVLALLTGAKRRVGYATEGRQFLLTDSVPFKTDMHEVDSTLTVLEAAGIKIQDRYLESWVSEAEQLEIDKLFGSRQPNMRYVLIHAAAAHPDKLYPLKSWAEIVKTLTLEHNFMPVFTGAEQDIPLYEELEKLSGAACLNFTGKLSLRLSMALYKKLDLAICTDSGPAHLAAAAGIPTLAIFGPTDPVRWRPYQAIAKNSSGERIREESLSPFLSTRTPTESSQKESTIKQTSNVAIKNSLKEIELIENGAIFAQELPCRPCNYNKTCTSRICLEDLSAQAVVARALHLFESTRTHVRT